MIISNLTGGLGNQMFQYAFGRYQAIKNGTKLKLHFTNALFNTQYTYELGVFKIKADIATHEDLKKVNVLGNRIINRVLYLCDERFGIQLNRHIITQKYPYKFDSNYLNIKDNSYIQGFWSDERYFKTIENILRSEFTLKKELDEKNRQILGEIEKSNSISIHVRRGDYVTHKSNAKNIGFVGLEYYETAIKEIKKSISHPLFFVFSNDIVWCRENLAPLSKNMHFISHNSGRNSYKDLILMSSCKHNIIANSTFSWWGAWLNTNKNKLRISPS